MPVINDYLGGPAGLGPLDLYRREKLLTNPFAGMVAYLADTRKDGCHYHRHGILFYSRAMPVSFSASFSFRAQRMLLAK